MAARQEIVNPPVLSLYPRHDPVAVRAYSGHDPRVCALAHDAVISWLLGDRDRAQRQGAEAIAYARVLRHPLSLMLAVYYDDLTRMLARDCSGVPAVGSERSKPTSWL